MGGSGAQSFSAVAGGSPKEENGSSAFIRTAESGSDSDVTKASTRHENFTDYTDLVRQPSLYNYNSLC